MTLTKLYGIPVRPVFTRNNALVAYPVLFDVALILSPARVSQITPLNDCSFDGTCVRTYKNCHLYVGCILYHILRLVHASSNMILRNKLTQGNLHGVVHQNFSVDASRDRRTRVNPFLIYRRLPVSDKPLPDSATASLRKIGENK